MNTIRTSTAGVRQAPTCPSGPRARVMTLTLSPKEFDSLDLIARRGGLSRTAAARSAIAFYRLARDPLVAAALREAEDRV